jgi:hypothetical protein
LFHDQQLHRASQDAQFRELSCWNLISSLISSLHILRLSHVSLALILCPFGIISRR